eukprot:gene646-2489_t
MPSVASMQAIMQGANSYNFLFYDSLGHDYLQAVQCLHDFAMSPALAVEGVPFTAWFTLIPPAETSLANCYHNKTLACCSVPPAHLPANAVPADSPLTPFNETYLFNQSLGYRGCHDYRAWAHLVGMLSQQFNSLRYLNVDDLVWDTDTFTPALVSNMATLVRPNARLVPVVYWPMLQQAARLPLDGMLYYFRNERQGGCPSACNPAVLHNCSSAWPGQGCLAGACALMTVGNLAGEVSQVRAAVGSDMPIHVGVYVTGRKPMGFDCSAPPPDYGRQVLEAALTLPQVSGVMAYRLQTADTPQRAAIAAAYHNFNGRCPLHSPFMYTSSAGASLCCPTTAGFPTTCSVGAAGGECCLVPARAGTQGCGT